MVALPSPDDPDKGFPDSAGGSSAVITTGDGSYGSSPVPLKEALARIAAAGRICLRRAPVRSYQPFASRRHVGHRPRFPRRGGKQLQTGLVGLEPWNRATMATADEPLDPYCLRLAADPSACFQPDKEVNQYARLEKGIEIGWQPLLLEGLKTNGDSAPSQDFPRSRV